MELADDGDNPKPSANNEDPVHSDVSKSFDMNETPEPEVFQPCFMCNGFYGPCYEDPICRICHSFVQSNPNMSAQKIYRTCLPEEKDDEDSGNDEPVEDNDRSENSGNDPLVTLPENDNAPQRVFDIEQLPPEVMILTLSHLDDLSMWAAALVNPRWKAIIARKVTTPEYWKNMVADRWPLFETPNTQVKDWFEVYSSLTKSSCCIKCLREMASRKTDNEDDSHWRQRRLCNELKSLRTDPPDGIEARPFDKQFCHWMATVQGPQGSPYEGGIFFLYLYISLEYPVIPPVVRFITKIYHPNISRHGDIGLDSIGNNWSLVLTISKVLISIQSLLTDPVSEVCMEPKIGEIYATDRLRYDDTARAWTWRYAMTQLLPH